jgi:hypothetical protein
MKMLGAASLSALVPVERIPPGRHGEGAIPRMKIVDFSIKKYYWKTLCHDYIMKRDEQCRLREERRYAVRWRWPSV